MKKLLVSIAATALLALPALAQPEHHEGGHGGGAPQGHGGAPSNGHAEHGASVHPPSGPSMHHSAQGGNSGRSQISGAPGYSHGPSGAGNGHPQNRRTMAGAHARPTGNARHDFHGFVDFHQNFNAPRHFRAGAYRRPAGWYAHHWVFGEFLPVAFWARSYWLTDYMAYALAPPPYGAVWVRVGDDALLVDQGSGEIITVEYGVFY